MTDLHRSPGEDDTTARDASAEPLLVDDVMLLLFQPSSGTIAGENTLFYVLGAAVLADLALRGLTSVDASGAIVTADGAAPADDTLRSGWSYIASRPRDVQSVIAAIGPNLRAEVLDRLVESGQLHRERKKVLGFIPSESLTLGGERRGHLLDAVRSTLVDGVRPDARIGAIASLLSASANLHRFDPDVPWTSAVIARAKELEAGSWSATAAGTAVTQATMAMITGALLASATAAGTTS
jgi:hypothetical protein